MERVFELLEAIEARKEEAKADQDQGTQGSQTGPNLPAVKQEPDVLAVPAPPKKKAKKSLASRMAGEVCDLTAPAENLRKEVAEYQASLTRTTNALQYWALHQSLFQNIAVLAKNYLSIPPTEVRQKIEISTWIIIHYHSDILLLLTVALTIIPSFSVFILMCDRSLQKGCSQQLELPSPS